MRDITLMPNDYIVTHIKTDTICEHFSNDDVVYAVEERVVPLVRCGECKHTYEWDSGCGAELVCKVRRCDPVDWGRSTEFYVKPYDFCSYGERREP